MATAGTGVFSGLRPKVAPHLLEDANASDCVDVYLTNGHLRPLPGLLADGSFNHEPVTIHKWEDSTYWMSFDVRTSIARSVNPAVDRIYITNVSLPPRVGNVGDAPGSIFYQTVNGRYPYLMYYLGVPKPTNPPLATITNEQPNQSRDYAALDQETRYYVYTHVNEWGEESAPSPVGEPVVCYDDSHVDVSISTAGSFGVVPIAAVRIYRTNTGVDATAFQYVGEATLAAASSPISDTTPSAYLGEVCETFGWDMPTSTLQNLTVVAGDFYAGTDGRELCLSVSKVPYAWPYAYRFPIDDPIVGLASNGAELVVLTRGRPVVVTGNNPDAVQLVRLADYQPCMSVDSITVFDGMVVYASPDGLIGISSTQGFRNLTQDILTREQWQALDPSTMRIVPYENVLWVCSSTGGYLFDVANATYTPTTLTFDAAYYDGYTDTLYVTQGADRFKAGQGTSLTYRWQSKEHLLPGTNYCSARVHATVYRDIIFDLFVDGIRVFRGKPRNAEPFRLPPVRGRVATFALTGTDTVRSASLATSPGELIV